MKLYYMPGASSLAVHIVLEWTGADYEAVRMKRANVNEAAYLALNAGGTVPLLLDGAFALTETVAILPYLADSFIASGLLGSGGLQARAEVMRWLGFLNSDVHKAFRPIFWPGRFLHDMEHAAQLVMMARMQVHAYLVRLDDQLRGKEWLTGHRSIADAYLFVMLRWAISTKIGLHGLDQLSSFMRRMHTDPGVHAALAAEEDLAPRPASAAALQRHFGIDDLADDASVELVGEIVGTVEYREGEGALLEIRRGLVAIEVNRIDTVFSWSDENYRGEAAMPFENFSRYVREGAITLRR